MALLHRIISGVLVTVLAGAGGCEETAPPGDAVLVPSGRVVRFLDVITDVAGTEGATARFRFVAPGLTDADDKAAADLQALCDSYALPRTEAMQPQPQQIVISLAAAETRFGEATPDVVQLFEAFSIQDGACIWEVF